MLPSAQSCLSGPSSSRGRVTHIQVPSQKRMKAVAQFMALEVEGLPHLETEPDEPRLFETWLPSKVIKAYSLRYSCKCNCLFCHIYSDIMLLVCLVLAVLVQVSVQPR